MFRLNGHHHGANAYVDKIYPTTEQYLFNNTVARSLMMAIQLIHVGAH